MEHTIRGGHSFAAALYTKPVVDIHVDGDEASAGSIDQSPDNLSTVAARRASPRDENRIACSLSPHRCGTIDVSHIVTGPRRGTITNTAQSLVARSANAAESRPSPGRSLYFAEHSN